MTSGAFLHIKGPEILNMWLGESERIVRDLFAKARARRKGRALPFIFIDEGESVLGTDGPCDRSILITPWYRCFAPRWMGSSRCKMGDHSGVEPAGFDRSGGAAAGRIDRKIKVARPNREAAVEILSVYLTSAFAARSDAAGSRNNQDHAIARRAVIEQVVEQLFSRTDQNRVLSSDSGTGKIKSCTGAISSAARSFLRSCSGRKREGDRTCGRRGLRRRHPDAGFGLDAVQEEYREGEMLPPDDAAEEWLKLLDHHPEQVVGVSSFRRGRPTEERLVNQII